MAANPEGSLVNGTRKAVAGSAVSKISSPAHLTKKPMARHWRCRYIAGVEIEGDLQPENSVSKQSDQRGQQAAGNGVGNVPAAQRRDTAIEAGAAEEHDDGDREGKQIGRLKGIRSLSVSAN